MIISTAVPHSQSLPAYQFGTAVHRPWVKMLGVNGQLKQDLCECVKSFDCGFLRLARCTTVCFDSQQFYERTNSHSIIQAIPACNLKGFHNCTSEKGGHGYLFPFDFPILENIHILSLALLVRCSYWFAEWDLSDCPRISLLDWISTRRKNKDNQDYKRGLFSLSFHLFFISRIRNLALGHFNFRIYRVF